MLKVKKLKKGDKIAIVSLSSGVLGEEFVKHELFLGIKNLRELGLEPVFMPNALKGIQFIKENYQARVDDLKQAFLDKQIKAILCAIGGSDTQFLTSIFINDKDFATIVKDNPKIFIGYSDTTTNHLLLNSLGLQTFYGMSFLSDFAELYREMLPYSKNNFKTLFKNKINTFIQPSDVWYYERKSFDISQLGVPRVKEKNNGYELLQGSGNVTGRLYGGCIDVLVQDVCFLEKGEYMGYKLSSAILDKKMFDNCVLLLEVSDQKPDEKEFENMLNILENAGIFNKCKAVLFGKPQDEVYQKEYHKILVKKLAKYNMIILANLNVGHAQPHTLLPLGALVEVDAKNKTIKTIEEVLF